MKVNLKNSFWHQFVEHFIVMCINQIFSKKSLETSSILILFKKKNTRSFACSCVLSQFHGVSLILRRFHLVSQGFFRRSIVKIQQNKESYKCIGKGEGCVLGPGKRNPCAACRYARCLEVGMSIGGSSQDLLSNLSYFFLPKWLHFMKWYYEMNS